MTPETGGVLDRDQARVIVGEIGRRGRDAHVTLDEQHVDVYLDRLAGCVRPAAIDRDALLAILRDLEADVAADRDEPTVEQYADRILALLRPPEAAS